MTKPAASRPSAELERQLDAYAASVRANGSQSWKKNLLNGSAYAAAAGSALAFATAADAGIIYSGPIMNGTISLIRPTSKGKNAKLTRSTNLPVPGLAARLSLDFRSSRTVGGMLRRLGTAFLRGTGKSFRVLGSNSAKTGLVNLSKSARVAGSANAGPKFVTRDFLRMRYDFPSFAGGKASSKGQWAKGVTGFAGFRFQVGTGAGGVPLYDYGWIRLEWNDFLVAYKGFPQVLTVVDWAYNNTPNAPIQVGDTGVPEPDSLLLLLIATGATGVQLWRRSRQTRAGQEA